MNNLMVVEDYGGMKHLDLDALLGSKGRIFLAEDINSDSASATIKKMMYLAEIGSPIKLYLDSNGGEIRAGLAIIDIMEALSKKVTVEVVCVGKAYSMASLILAAGTKGHRYIMPHGEIMIHEPLIMSGGGGSASEVRNRADSLLKIRDKISDMMSQYTGLPTKRLKSLMKATTFMDAEKAIELGIVDKIITEI